MNAHRLNPPQVTIMNSSILHTSYRYLCVNYTTTNITTEMLPRINPHSYRRGRVIIVINLPQYFEAQWHLLQLPSAVLSSIYMAVKKRNEFTLCSSPIVPWCSGSLDGPDLVTLVELWDSSSFVNINIWNWYRHTSVGHRTSSYSVVEMVSIIHTYRTRCNRCYGFILAKRVVNNKNLCIIPVDCSHARET